MRRTNGFTIYELLGIIVVLVILAAILFPVYRRTVESARKDDCMTHIKNVGTALNLYTLDNDDTLPMAYRTAPKAVSAFAHKYGTALSWADLISRYAKVKDLWLCPIDKGTSRGLSYAMNEYFYRMPSGIENFSTTGGSLSELPFAQHKILVGETVAKMGRLTIRPDEGEAFARHQGDGSNFLYADLHAQFHQPPASWKTTSASVWEKPELAEKQSSPQWIPWQETASEKW